MTFEHIVQIKDLTKPELPVLTRFQVWEGLVLRARRLGRFLSASGITQRASRTAVTRCPMISISMKRMWPQTWKPFRSYGNWRRRVFSSPVPFHQPRVTAPMFPDSYRG